MIIYVAFDDTDTLDCGRGTGKLARWFESKLPEGCSMTGVVRHQLLVADDIPYTSHNSSLCCVIEAPDNSVLDILIEQGTEHIREHFFEGSDPGLCVVAENHSAIPSLTEFGIRCTGQKTFQKEALAAAGSAHLSGHGGTHDGIIGAAAAVGLTAQGMSGRFIEFGQLKLRDFPETTPVAQLLENGMTVLPVDRHSRLPLSDEMVFNDGWLRPRLLMGKAVVPVVFKEDGVWHTVNKEQSKKGGDR